MTANVKTNEDVMSVHQLWSSGKIYWIGTYKTLLRYVSSDYKEIFKPIVKGGRTGKRYFVKTKNVNDFITKFETNKLSE